MKIVVIGAGALLRRNLLIYGVGGVIAPFVGIYDKICFKFNVC